MISTQSNFDLNKIFGIDITLADSLSVGLFYTDNNGKYLYANSKWLEIADISLDETLGNGWLDAIHFDDRERINSEWDESIKNNHQFVSEYRFQANDKSIKWVICQANKHKDKNGNISGYVGTITDITERKQKEEELKSLNKELEFKQFSVENISESIFWTDESIRIFDVNEAACKSLGYTKDELLKLTIFDIDPSITESELKEHRKKRKELKTKNVFETCHMTKYGRIFPVEITASYINFDGHGYHCSIVRDISEKKAIEKERDKNISLQNAIFEATADGIVVTNLDKLFTSYNQNFIKLWGFKDVNLLDVSYESRIELMCEKLKYPDSFKVRIKEIYEAIEEDTFDIIELKDGTIMERVSRPQRLEGKVVGRVWNFRDITEKHKLSEQLSYQANHDPLTGLINRREFEKRLVRVLASLDGKSEHAMCYMDLDNFKQINDICGHLAGDYLLKQISDLFQQNSRTRDTLARLGGDEFGLIMEHCNVERANKIATNFIALINESDFTWENRTFDIGVSIGIVKIDNPSIGMLEVMKNADIACYAAKKSGRNCVHIS